MEGKKEFILMEWNKQQIKFDIKVTTTTGVVYFMYLHHDEEIAHAAVEYSTSKSHECSACRFASMFSLHLLSVVGQ
jgi:hypothetical protein